MISIEIYIQLIKKISHQVTISTHFILLLQFIFLLLLVYRLTQNPSTYIGLWNLYFSDFWQIKGFICVLFLALAFFIIFCDGLFMKGNVDLRVGIKMLGKFFLRTLLRLKKKVSWYFLRFAVEWFFLALIS